MQRPQFQSDSDTQGKQDMLTQTAKQTTSILNLAYYKREFKGDKFMQFAVRDLMSKGVEELRAHIIVFNTYND